MKITIFNFDGNNVRTANVNGEVWFVAKDVCDVLGTQTNNITTILDHDEISNSYEIDIRIPGVNRGMRMVNESGMYALVMRSNKTDAKKFRKWVTAEVLPTIRKHGAYMTDSTLDKVVDDPDFIVKLAEKLKIERDLRIKAEKERIWISDKKTATAMGTASAAMKKLRIAENKNKFLALQVKTMKSLESIKKEERGKYTPYKRTKVDICVHCGKTIGSVYGMIQRPEYNNGQWVGEVHVDCFEKRIDDVAMRKYLEQRES